MKKVLVLLIVAFLSSFSLSAQEQCCAIQKDHFMSEELLTVLDSLSITYSPPVNFVSDLAGEGFGTVPHLKRLHGCMYYIVSKDNNFLVCFYAEHITGKNPFDETSNISYLKSVEGDIRVSLSPKTDDLTSMEGKGKNTEIQLKNHVTYCPLEYAKNNFNADTVIRYSLNMNGLKLQGQYTDNTVLTLQKKGKGFITLYCFYTKEGKRKINDYMKVVENMLWFRDYCPSLRDVKVIPFSKINPPTIIN